MIDGQKGAIDERPAEVGERAGFGHRMRRLSGLFARLAERVPERWAFVGVLFVGSKLVLTVVGLLALHAYDGVVVEPPPDDAWIEPAQRATSSHRWISMWFAWDSFHYHQMGRESLDGEWSVAFAPLYPLLGRAGGVVLGGHTAIALLVVSNVAYLFLLYYAYRLAEQLVGDDAAARRFTRYVVLMPAAFLFQAALTESLFVCLALAAFFYAERSRWLMVGVVGYFLALSRSIGFLVVVPLALILLQQHQYRLGPRSLWGYVKAGWPLVLLPAGWLSFMAFCKWQTGDWFAYNQVQQEGWNIVMHNPLRTLRDGLTVAEPTDTIRVWFAVLVLAIVAVGLAVRYLKPAYVVYTLIVVIAPLVIGPPVYKSLIRYLLAAFPMCLVFARWARSVTVDMYLTATLALVQGALFVLWLAYWTHFII